LKQGIPVRIQLTIAACLRGRQRVDRVLAPASQPRQKLATWARGRWPQLTGVTVRWHGQFAYVGGQIPDGTTLPLFRLRYADSASTRGFAIYRASHDDYGKSLLPADTPQEALDCARGPYLGDHTAWDPPDELITGVLTCAVGERVVEAG
jgi:hypothetical protein